MKRYHEIHVGMRFISGMLPNKDHRHLMEVMSKASNKEALVIKSIKCLGELTECAHVLGSGEYYVNTEELANIEKQVYFEWLDTEVAKILYERD